MQEKAQKDANKLLKNFKKLQQKADKINDKESKILDKELEKLALKESDGDSSSSSSAPKFSEITSSSSSSVNSGQNASKKLIGTVSKKLNLKKAEKAGMLLYPAQTILWSILGRF